MLVHIINQSKRSRKLDSTRPTRSRTHVPSQRAPALTNLLDDVDGLREEVPSRHGSAPTTKIEDGEQEQEYEGVETTMPASGLQLQRLWVCGCGGFMGQSIRPGHSLLG